MDLTPLIQAADTKILLVVMDGLGGYADGEHGTELEEADTPHLDQLAAEGVTGLVEPVGPGERGAPPFRGRARGGRPPPHIPPAPARAGAAPPPPPPPFPQGGAPPL